jgi:hypothetical protein
MYSTIREALEIAMNYLESTGQAENYREIENLATTVILQANRQGIHNRIVLANKAIVAVESGQHVDLDLPSLYPRAFK